jgi:hypothetical protein
MKEILWKLFKTTGDIRYYNLFSKIEGSSKDANSKSRRNSTKRN